MAIRNLLTRGALVLASFTLAAAANVLTWGTAHAATVTTRPAHSSSWYDTATCEALMRWHATHRGFSVIVRDARHADAYLRVDVALLARHRTAVNAWYVDVDCTMSPDQAASQ